MLCIHYFLIKRKKLFGRPNISVHIDQKLISLKRYFNVKQTCCKINISFYGYNETEISK